jgi:phospholipid/cholesterol/gamma-HCH transport system substrate-binding protein
VTHELSRRAVLGTAVVFALAATLAVAMLARMGAVPVPGAGARSVMAVLRDAEGLPAGADVLVHGVRVGTVSAIHVSADGRTTVTLGLDPSAPVLHPDATVRVGFKTAFGEPFVDLVPGHAPGRAGPRLRARPTVEFDDALAVLNAGGRANLRGVFGALAAGTRPETASQLSGTLSALDAATERTDQLAAELAGQAGDLRGLLGAGRAVLDTLAARARALRALVVDARRTLEPLSAQRAAIGAVLHRLPDLLADADGLLSGARPLIARATPLVAQIRAAAPALTAALHQLPGTVASAQTLLAGAGRLRSAMVPLLRAVRRLAGPGAAALAGLGPAMADLVPVARFLGPRGNTIAAWFANTEDLGSHGDAKGNWARFFINFDPATLTGTRGGAPPANAYTAPNDAAHNAAYASGGYPRLLPYYPALKEAPTR